MNTQATFAENSFYHIYNRTNNKEPLFLSDNNRIYFLRLINQKLTPFINIYSYALLLNHFHLSVSVKSISQIVSNLESIPQYNLGVVQKKFLDSEIKSELIHDLISMQFSGLFNSYSQAFNKMQGRNGNLFHRPFKRALIKHHTKFAFNQYYVHHNSEKHKVCHTFIDDPWHSYHTLISDKETFLNREYVLNFFGGKEEFIKFHNTPVADINFEGISIED